QAVTGVGFKPRAAIFIALAGVVLASVGVDDGTTHGSSVADRGDGNAALSATESIMVGSDTTTTNQKGHISTLGTDGFTITWTKTGTPTGTATIIYLVIQ